MATNLATCEKQSNPVLFVASGCPFSGWEVALPTLAQLSVEPGDKIFCEWLKEVFPQGDTLEQMALGTPVQTELAAPDLDKGTFDPWLFSDSRNIHLLDFWAERYPEARFLLFYTSSETALASALTQGVDPEAFLSGWLRGNQQLMRFQRRYRDRTLMFNAERVRHNRDEFVEACGRIGLNRSAEEGDTSSDITYEVGALERLIARQWLAQGKDHEILQYELEACAMPLGGSEEAHLDTLAAASDQYLLWRASGEQEKEERRKQTELIGLQEANLRRMAEQHDHDQRDLNDLQTQFEMIVGQAKTLEGQRSEADQEIELLLLQLHQVQEEFEEVLLGRKELEKELDALEGKRTEAEQEVGRLLVQLHRVQKELEEIVLGRKVLEKERDTLQAEQKVLEARVGQARTQAETLKAEKSEVEQENELLLVQLHQVQEELEHYFLLHQELTDKGLSDESQGEKLAGQRNEEDEEGAKSGRFSLIRGRNTKARRKEKKLVRLLKKSGLFDVEWYLARYADVAEANYEPIKHYLRFGAVEGRDPSPHFCTRFYLDSYPDVGESGMNPLVHYIGFGREEGRQPKESGND